MDPLPRQSIKVIRWFELILAFAVFIGVIAASIGAIQVLIREDWRVTETFYDLIYRVLLLVIGVELVRMLIVHDLLAVLELLAFVIARKVLKPDVQSIDIFLAVMAFVALLYIRRYLVGGKAQPFKAADSTSETDCPTK